MAVPPVSGKPAVNTQELGFWVRNWAHYNDQATALYRQTVNSRKVRDEFETKILDTLRTNNMENAVIQITGGKLSVHEERHNQPLTLQRIDTTINMADLFTKSLGPTLFYRHTDYVLGHVPPHYSPQYCPMPTAPTIPLAPSPLPSTNMLLTTASFWSAIARNPFSIVTTQH